MNKLSLRERARNALNSETPSGMVHSEGSLEERFLSEYANTGTIDFSNPRTFDDFLITVNWSRNGLEDLTKEQSDHRMEYVTVLESIYDELVD